MCFLCGKRVFIIELTINSMYLSKKLNITVSIQYLMVPTPNGVFFANFIINPILICEISRRSGQKIR